MRHLPSTLTAILATSLLGLLGACEGGPEHTVVIDSRDVAGGTDYTIEVSGSVTQVDSTLDGIPVSGGDQVSGGSATGSVGGGADGFRVTGEITSIELSDAAAARVLVDGEPYYTEEHTVVIVPEGGGTDYTMEVAGGTLEQVDDSLAGRAVTADPADNVDGSSATAAVDSTADGYRVRGGLPSIDLADADAATVYLDGREHHTVIVDGRVADGRTDYAIEVSGSLTQVDDELEGVPVSGGDQVSGGSATGSVGGGADGFRVSGEVTSIEVSDAAAARVLVDGEPHYTEQHTIVVDGTGQEGTTGYRIRVTGTVEKARDSLAGRSVSVEDSDQVGDGTATGSVEGDADGYRIRGGITAIELDDPTSATVYLDGREYHTLVIDSGNIEGNTDYTIEVSGRLEQVDGSIAGFSVSGGDRVSGSTATGTVGGGADGFRVFGSITRIELSDPDGAVVYVDGAARR